MPKPPLPESVHLHNALDNFAPNSGASDDYLKGLVVGVVSGICAGGCTFDMALSCCIVFIRARGYAIVPGKNWPPTWPTTVPFKE